MPSSSSAVHRIHAERIVVGDRVRWNQYRGEVLSVNYESAVILERDNIALGGNVKWRIDLAALKKIVDRDQC
jgi:hypothetical protein